MTALIQEPITTIERRLLVINDKPLVFRSDEIWTDHLMFYPARHGSIVKVSISEGLRDILRQIEESVIATHYPGWCIQSIIEEGPYIRAECNRKYSEAIGTIANQYTFLMDLRLMTVDHSSKVIKIHPKLIAYQCHSH